MEVIGNMMGAWPLSPVYRRWRFRGECHIMQKVFLLVISLSILQMIASCAPGSHNYHCIQFI